MSSKKTRGPHRFGPNWRTKDGVDQIRVESEVLFYEGTLDDLLIAIGHQSKGMEDTTLRLDSRYEYGETYADLDVIGWRAATASEIARAQLDIDNSRAAAAARTNLIEAELRKTRPEIFKEK